MQVVLIDNYDSFTWNLAHLVSQSFDGALPTVIRNDAATTEEILSLEPRVIFFSPGPRKPVDAGIMLELIKKASIQKIPMFGVCLGFQAIGQAFGAKIIKAPEPIHGKIDEIFHQNDSMFKNVPSPFRVVRYHSLMLEKNTIPQELKITAHNKEHSQNQTIAMAIKHQNLPIAGVLFHPESYSSESGNTIIANFLAEHVTNKNSRSQVSNV